MEQPPVVWSERAIGCAIFAQAFTRKHVCLIPNTYYTGYEADVLVVRNDLRLMDIEIKISRSDFKADQKKDKWWDNPTWWGSPRDRPASTKREWPPKIWKHYYALPRAIWKDGLETEVSAKSGILLFSEGSYGVQMSVHRQAKPNRDAKQITATEAIEVARACNARMWGAYGELETKKNGGKYESVTQSL